MSITPLPSALKPLWPGAATHALKRLKAALTPPARTAPVQLALQGGGAHGAFTWGVLDHLLRDQHLSFDAISGSSAGAMNAVVMAEGWRKGGRSGARHALKTFWGAVGEQIPASMASVLGLELAGGATVGTMMRTLLASMSPTQLNPLDHNPLRDILLEQVDFEALRHDCPFALHIAATHVRTGRLRLFREHELTVDHLLASACLPTLHHTVVIDGEAYWDGGLSANPALFPLIANGGSLDVLMVLLTAPEPELSLDNRREIDQRLTGLAFSTHLMRELEMIDLLKRRAHRAWWPSRQERHLRELRLHWIDVREIDALRDHNTKLLACTPFLQELRELGRQSARRWHQAHRDSLGRHGSFEMSVLA